MGNAKSRNNTERIEEKEFSRILSSNKELPTATTTRRKWKAIEDNQATTTTTITSAAITVGGPLSVDVKNNKTTENSNKTIKASQLLQVDQKQQQCNKQRQQKAADSSVNSAAAEQQRLKQASSLWNLGSLNWNLSYSGRNSFKQRQKSSRKSFHNLQQDKRSKTQWHKPLTNVIFSSHFKGISRNEEFHIDQLVAKGAFGVVFKVINKKQQEQHHQQGELDSCPTVYALKVLKKSKIISENSLQQIKDEVDIQKLCGHHPFIVKQIDLWQNRYNLHILSEYVPNGELFSTIRTFSLNLVRLYLAEIALALNFLHNAGIIYRDAKPENILLTADYHLKLTDFGLSKWLKFGLTTKTMCGTFQYMAPEILRGEPYTHAVDWWSLGIIVCQMFVKKSPDIRQFITIKLPSHLQSKDSVDKAFIAQKSLESLASESITSSDGDFLPLEVHSLPHEARDVLQRLLEFDSQKRIHSVRALQRIAMYKDFSIEAQHCLKIHPLDIIKADNIRLKTKDLDQEAYYSNPSKAFKDF